MGIIIPSIPYKSQNDPDASKFRNDCGPASLAMVLHAFGVTVSTNAVFRKTGAPDNGFVSVGQLRRASQSYGVPLEYRADQTLAQLRKLIRSGKPLIALVHYGAFVQVAPGQSTQSKFTGPHFLVVVAYDDQHVYVNDPLWSGTRRSEGERLRWTNAQFMAAWGECKKDGNRNFTCLYPTKALSTDAWGLGVSPLAPPPPPPEPVFKIDPATFQRLLAWASFFGVAEPPANNPAAINAYVEAMSDWGLRFVPHTVSADDDLGMLSLRYYDDPLRWEAILKFNGLTVADTIHDGDVLNIPEPLERPVPIPAAQVPTGSTRPHGLGGLDENVNMM